MVKIDDKYYITANSNCYTLQEKSTVQDKYSPNYGKEYFIDLGYYGTLDGALNGLLKAETRKYIGQDKIVTLEGVRRQITKWEKYIKSLNISF